MNTPRLFLSAMFACLILISSFTQITACSMRCSFSATPSPLMDVSADASVSTLYTPASGWSKEKLEIVKNYVNEIGSTAIVILHKDNLVAEWGNTDKKISSHSVRKSLLSALYGIAIEKGQIDITSD